MDLGFGAEELAENRCMQVLACETNPVLSPASRGLPIPNTTNPSLRLPLRPFRCLVQMSERPQTRELDPFSLVCRNHFVPRLLRYTSLS